MSELLNYNIIEFHLTYPEYSLLEEYISYFKSANPQTKDDLKKFLKQLGKGFQQKKYVFRAYYGIKRTIPSSMFPIKTGIRLFIRAVFVHKHSKFADKIISHTYGGYAENYRELITMSSDEDVLKTFMDCILRNSCYLNNIFVLFHNDFPEICKQWFDENIDENYESIVHKMTKDVSCARIIFEYIKPQDDEKHDYYLMRRAIKLGDNELIADVQLYLSFHDMRLSKFKEEMLRKFIHGILIEDYVKTQEALKSIISVAADRYLLLKAIIWKNPSHIINMLIEFMRFLMINYFRSTIVCVFKKIREDYPEEFPQCVKQIFEKYEYSEIIRVMITDDVLAQNLVNIITMDELMKKIIEAGYVELIEAVIKKYPK